MKKHLIRMALAGALALGVASVAKADARLDSLATDVRQVDDIDIIWLYPNQILSYKNTVDFRLNPSGNASGVGGSNTEWGGVIHDLGDDFGTIATYVNRPSAETTGTSTLLGANRNLLTNYWQPAGGAGNPVATSSNLDLFWAKSDLGLHLNYADNLTDGGAAVQGQTWGLSAGLNTGAFMSFNQTQIHLGYTEQWLTNTAANGGHDQGIYSITGGFLAQTDLNPNDSARVYGDAEFDAFHTPGNNSGFGAGVNTNATEILVGGSIKHNIASRGFVNTGLAFEYDGSQSGLNNPNAVTNNNMYSLIWNAGVESSLNSFLTARAGLAKAIYNRAYSATAGAASWTDPSLLGGTAINANKNVSFNIGGSINVENWTLDSNINVTTLENSLQAIAPGTGIMFAGTAIATTETDLRYKF